MSDVPLEERRVIDAVFEGLFLNALKRKVTPKLERRLEQMGVQLGKKLEPRYPHQIWLAALTAAAEELHPGVPLPQAFEELGAAVVVGYFETFIGAALKPLLKAMGVRRTLGRMTQNFSASNNYTQSRLKELGPGHAELWMNELTLTQHNLTGILRQGLTIIGGQGVQVRMIANDDQGCTHEVRWQ